MSSHETAAKTPTELEALILLTEETHIALGILVDCAHTAYLKLLNERRHSRAALHALYTTRQRMHDAELAARAKGIVNHVQSLED